MGYSPEAIKLLARVSREFDDADLSWAINKAEKAEDLTAFRIFMDELDRRTRTK